MKYTYDSYEHANGRNDYKITESGIAYHIDTPDDLVTILEHIRINNIRITLDYGDTKTGKSWNEEYYITGTLGRSNGKFKIPILVHNARSWGGGSILDHCIIGIKHANKKDGGAIYKLNVHPDGVTS